MILSSRRLTAWLWSVPMASRTCPHPDHDHEYTVPDMEPALSRKGRRELRSGSCFCLLQLADVVLDPPHYGANSSCYDIFGMVQFVGL